jgi:hypothetical protein
MAITITLKKSSVNGKRPSPLNLVNGELALNYSAADNGVYYKDSAGDLVKVGSAHVGEERPNNFGTGYGGYSLGEFWYVPSVEALQIWDGNSWVLIGDARPTPFRPGAFFGERGGPESFNSNVSVGYQTLGGPDYLTFQGTENVAIGQDAMAEKTTEMQSVAIGYSALGGSNLGPSAGNVAIGHSSGVSLQEGEGNILLGLASGTTLELGSGNVVIGAGAQTSSVQVDNELTIGSDYLAGNKYWIRGDGNRNVSLGAGLRDSSGSLGTAGQVLASNGVGIEWGTLPPTGPATPTALGTIYGCSLNSPSFATSVGFNALSSLAAGANNTAVGYNSLCSVVTGTRNTAVGACSLRLSTGRCNTAVGESAGETNMGGEHNTFLGYSSGSGLRAISSGNTTVGSCSGIGLTTGNNNTTLGYLAIGDVTGSATGSTNVAVGFCAGYGLTSGSCNVIIGPQTNVTLPAGNQQLAIGSNNVTWIRGNSTGAVQFANTILDSGGNTGNTGQYLSRNGSGGLVWVNGVGAYVLPYASTTVLGGVCVDGTTITVSPTGVISTTAQAIPDATPAVAGIVFGQTNGDVKANTSLGNLALNALTTGTNNTAIGQNSLRLTTSGSRNTALGAGTAQNITTGSDNTAIGFGSLLLSSNSAGNVAVGNCALSSMTANDPGNVAVGFCALSSLNGAGQACRNVAVGCQTGCGVTTGRHNTFFGHASGRNVTTGCGNVVIGACVQVADPEASLQLVIGSNDWITGGNWITGDSGFNVQIVRGLRDSTGALGTNGQTLTTTGTQTRWATTSVNAATPTSAGTVFAKTCAAGPTFLGQCAGNAVTNPVSNTGVGLQVLQSATSLGVNNTGVGNLALCSITGGTDNTAVGSNALRSPTGVASRNTAIGSGAAVNIGASCGVVAIGATALGGTITAGNVNDSVAIGNCALAVLTAGANTAVGGLAGASTSTGALNTLVGRCAGNSVTTGSSNTALGDSALKLGGTTSNNTAVGANALSGNLPGGCNTALGFGAMSGSTASATSNTAIGVNALCSTTSTSNVAIGFNAGCNLTTGTNNVFIGPNVLAQNATGSNQLVIGYGGTYWVCGDSANNVRFGGGIRDTSGTLGTAGQVLQTTGTGTSWSNTNVVGTFAMRERNGALEFYNTANNRILMKVDGAGNFSTCANITAFSPLT